MYTDITAHEFSFEDGKTRYLEAGPEDGPLLIFIHGWIAVAETWKPQLLAFSSLGFHVVAPDTRGYGGSTVTKNVRDYALERHNSDMLALLKHLGYQKATWIGHDWGAPLVWGLVAHHPEVCTGVVGLAVPYRTIEFGLDRLVSLVNRDIYPIDKYPYGQWDYQAFHAEQRARSEATLDADPANTIKNLYTGGDPASHGKPAFTSIMRQIGGWWGQADTAPEKSSDGILPSLLNDQDMFDNLVGTISKNGTFGPNAYYLNHDVNKIYTEKSVNDGVLEMPVLFIGAEFDSICATTLSPLSEPMRQACRDLTECTIDSGHWIALEKPCETNAAIARWLLEKFPTLWPGYEKTPFESTSVL